MIADKKCAVEAWLNYEAGVLAKSLAAGRVVPYLIGMEGAADVPQPARFLDPT